MRVELMWALGADPSLGLPSYATIGAAGADLRANVPEGDVTLAPGARALIPTGLCMAVPSGFEVQIRARSGLALKHGVGLVNAPGTIDCDYRGPVGVLLINWGRESFTVTHGLRIAQMVLAPVVQATFDLVEALDQTTRGDGGFGSTGTS